MTLSSAILTQANQWVEDAKACAEMKEPTAMALATATPQAMPSVRIVLLKGLDERGPVFYTNSESQKGDELLTNPQASLCCYWMPLSRQLRFSGKVERVSDAESDAYFASRRRGSQIGAWASQQSRPLASTQALQASIAEVSEQYEGKDVPRPMHWFGWRVIPQVVEFWQEGEFRIHHREQHVKQADGSWRTQLLNP